MRRLLILTEEESIQPIIDEMCKSFLPLGSHYDIIPFQGWRLLQQKMTRQLKQSYGADFIITQDTDAKNCIALKQHLLSLVPKEKMRFTKIRLVCNELENWYLGDLNALITSESASSEQVASIKKLLKSQKPDEVIKPKETIFIPVLGYRSAPKFASKIAPSLIENHAHNTSHSFQLMVQTLKGYHA